MLLRLKYAQNNSKIIGREKLILVLYLEHFCQNYHKTNPSNLIIQLKIFMSNRVTKAKHGNDKTMD